MMNNNELFEYSKKHPEEIFDTFYAKNKVVIPESAEKTNLLTENNEKLIKLITAFSVLEEYDEKKNEISARIVDDIIGILDNTPNINYCAFAQFFMVYNSNYSVYRGLEPAKKRDFISEMLKRYCKERHGMYTSHGYSNAILQVMCDNYSHKRNSKTGIQKVCSMLAPYHVERLKDERFIITADTYYFLPDKGDKRIFEAMLKVLDLKMESREIEQSKLPDIVFKHNDNYYICELKTMKEGGGGQNKQVVEIAYFIKFSEEKDNVHYITFLDCSYSNTIFHDRSPKVTQQRKDIINALNNNPTNYFLNTAGMKKFIREVFKSE